MKVINGEINPTMEVCNKCWELSKYCALGKTIRCDEHRDLPEGCLGAVLAGNRQLTNL